MGVHLLSALLKDVEKTADWLVPEDEVFLNKLKQFMSRDKTYEDFIHFYFDQLSWPRI